MALLLRSFSRASIVLVAAVLWGCADGHAQPVPDRLDAFAADTDFSGVLLVATGDTVHTQAYGWADMESERSMDADARFQLGSISKWLSTLVVLRLVDEERLDLDAPIGATLPALPVETGERVTLRHLLSHTSGVPNQIVEAMQADPASVMSESLSTGDAVTRYASGPLGFEPGAAFDYSHSNWILVLAMVEAVTGQPFEAVVAETLTGPLGLADTGTFGGDFDTVPDMAVGYTDTGADPLRAPAAFPRYLTAAGGFYSTAPDLLRLLDGLYAGGLLSPASLDALDTVHVDGEDYALGGRVRTMEVGGES